MNYEQVGKGRIRLVFSGKRACVSGWFCEICESINKCNCNLPPPKEVKSKIITLKKGVKK